MANAMYETLVELGRWVEAATGDGDQSLLLDPKRPASTLGVTRGTPSEYRVWVVSVDRRLTETGKPIGVGVNVRCWTRVQPTTRNPQGYVGPVAGNRNGGVFLPIDGAQALAGALGVAGDEGANFLASNPEMAVASSQFGTGDDAVKAARAQARAAEQRAAAFVDWAKAQGYDLSGLDA